MYHTLTVYIYFLKILYVQYVIISILLLLFSVSVIILFMCNPVFFIKYETKKKMQSLFGTINQQM